MPVLKIRDKLMYSSHPTCHGGIKFFVLIQGCRKGDPIFSHSFEKRKKLSLCFSGSEWVSNESGGERNFQGLRRQSFYVRWWMISMEIFSRECWYNQPSSTSKKTSLHVVLTLARSGASQVWITIRHHPVYFMLLCKTTKVRHILARFNGREANK